MIQVQTQTHPNAGAASCLLHHIPRQHLKHVACTCFTIPHYINKAHSKSRRGLRSLFTIVIKHISGNVHYLQTNASLSTYKLHRNIICVDHQFIQKWTLFFTFKWASQTCHCSFSHGPAAQGFLLV